MRDGVSFAAVVAAAWLGLARAAEAPAPVLRSLDELEWKASTNLPPGAEYHLVREDPVTHGVQVLARFPSGFTVPSHAHEADETLVVVKGRLRVKAAGTERVLSAGDYAVLPAGSAHELSVKGMREVLLLATTSAPYDLKSAP